MSDFVRRGSVAGAFNYIAESTLTILGFSLINDPAKSSGPYSSSSAIYRSEQGLYLHIGFEPMDGNYAFVRFGRKWSFDSGAFSLSANLSVFAKKKSLEFPGTYTLGFDAERMRSLERIVGDLKVVLPSVLDRLILDDIEDAEDDVKGAKSKAKDRYGEEYLSRVSISECDLAQHKIGL
jgi:hypothetical protein